MRIEKFKKHHFDLIELQQSQQVFYKLIKDDFYRDVIEGGDSYSLLSDDGLDCYVCGGIVDMGFGRGQGWCLISSDAGKYMFQATKYIKRYLNSVKYNRIEATVEQGFSQGFRWINILGFECEGLMRNYMNGINYYLYARYK